MFKLWLWWRTRQLASSDYGKQRRAVRALGAAGDARAVPILLAFCEERETWRRPVKEALKTLGSAAFEGLVEALRASKNEVKELAVTVLAHLKDERAVLPILRAASQAPDDLLVTVTRELQDSPFAAQLRTQAAQNPDSGVRAVAAVILARERDRHALELLLKALTTAALNPYLRREAEKCLPDLLRPKDLEAIRATSAYPKALRYLASMTNDRARSREDRRWAACLLGDLGDPRVTAFLKRVYQRSDDPLRCDAVEILARLFKCRHTEGEPTTAWTDLIPLLLEDLNSGDGQLRVAAGALLVQMDDPRVRPAFARLLDDPAAEVRRMALRLHVTLGDTNVLNSLLSILMKDKNASKDAANDILKLLERNAMHASVRDLQAIATLTQVTTVAYSPGACQTDGRGQYCGWGGQGFYDTPLDCSAIRQLAKQELIRRGLKA